MQQRYDVLIVGGGVIGLTTAYFLAKEGLRVGVFDKGDFGQESSWAGAGILPVTAPEPNQIAEKRIRSLSAAMFPDLSNELRELTGIDNGYWRCGGLEFTGAAGEADAEEWHGRGDAAALLDEATLGKTEAGLAPNLGSAFQLPDMAQIRNPRHMQALVAACGATGVDLCRGCPVQCLINLGRLVVGVRTLTGEIFADRVLLTLGAWTRPLLDTLGWSLRIRPIRGQIVLLHCEPLCFRHILLWGSRYLVPRADGRVLVGSTEEDVGFDKRTTASAVADLIGLATRLVPRLADAPVERCWAGLRPGSHDGLPYLGVVPGWDKVYVAAGHFRAGIQLSPATALVMKELLLGKPTSFSLEPFRLDR
jgi:glycine oxidase